MHHHSPVLQDWKMLKRAHRYPDAVIYGQLSWPFAAGYPFFDRLTLFVMADHLSEQRNHCLLLCPVFVQQDIFLFLMVSERIHGNFSCDLIRTMVV